MTYPVITIPDNAGEKIEQLGTKLKFWYDADTKLYKEGRPGTGENWAEKVACEICAVLGVPHAHYELAIWRGRQGVVSDSFVPGDCRYVTANEVLSKIYPDYAGQKRYEARQHTVRTFMAIGSGSRVELPNGYNPPPAIRRADDLMVGYLMIDALIGNQDRHDQNWGFVVCPGKVARVALAPTFDHASSLGRNESDENRNTRLHTNDRGRSVEAYAARARSGFFANAEARKTMTTLDAFLAAGRIRQEAAQYWLQVLSKLSANELKAIFRKVPQEFISRPAVEFALGMLEANKARLLNAVVRE